MEFLQGKTLKAILSEQGPLPVDTVLQIVPDRRCAAWRIATA